MKYLVVIERTETGYSAYCPDLPGCLVTGETREEVERNIKEGIAFHLEGMREDGEHIPEPKSYSRTLDIAV
ncbi:MAG: type II toxin-antitoxin system HicB family antitoxin [Thermodesulfobacteriota bacterium]